MGPLDLLNHLLNFMAPAAWVAVAVTFGARFFMPKRPVARSRYAKAAINFAVCLGALVLGLLVVAGTVTLLASLRDIVARLAL